MTPLVSVIIVVVLIILGVNNADSETTPLLSSALVGGCYDDVDDVFIHCALIAEECEQRSNIRFMRAHELSALGNYKCSTDDIPLGICKNTGQCAITKDSCADPFYFSSPNGIYGECNAEGRFMDGDFIPTQYGACKSKIGEITCVLNPADCIDDDIWIPPSDVEEEQNGGCKCHDVKIGFCKGTSSTNLMPSDCAISVYDCHPLMQKWFSALHDSEVDCRLCPYDQFSAGESYVAPESNEYVPEYVPESGENINMSVESKSKDSTDVPNTYEQVKETIEEVEEHAIHRGEFVGLIVGLCTAFFIAVVLFLWCCGEYENSHDVHFHTDVPPLD